MKSIKIKANDFYGKKQVSEVTRKVFGYYITLNLFESAYIYTHVLFKSKQWIYILKKANI